MHVPRMVPPTLPCTSVHFSSSSVRASAAPLVTFQVYIPSLLTLEVWGSYNQISRRQVMQMTRLEDLTPAPSMTLPIEHSSRPTLGFPLGTALQLLCDLCPEWHVLMLLPLGQAPLPPLVSASCLVRGERAHGHLHRVITEQDDF